MLKYQLNPALKPFLHLRKAKSLVSESRFSDFFFILVQFSVCYCVANIYFSKAVTVIISLWTVFRFIVVEILTICRVGLCSMFCWSNLKIFFHNCFLAAFQASTQRAVFASFIFPDSLLGCVKLLPVRFTVNSNVFFLINKAGFMCNGPLCVWVSYFWDKSSG